MSLFQSRCKFVQRLVCKLFRLILIHLLFSQRVYRARICARLAAVSVLGSRPRECALERSEATKPLPHGRTAVEARHQEICSVSMFALRLEQTEYR